jgi:hypothetical protein
MNTTHFPPKWPHFGDQEINKLFEHLSIYIIVGNHMIIDMTAKENCHHIEERQFRM